MTIEQFSQLTEMEQVSAIMEYGILMSQREEYDNRIFIYSFESFYVSACYTLLNDQLIEIGCFSEVREVSPYLRGQLSAVDPAARQYDTPEL